MIELFYPEPPLLLWRVVSSFSGIKCIRIENENFRSERKTDDLEADSGETFDLCNRIVVFFTSIWSDVNNFSKRCLAR